MIRQKIQLAVASVIDGLFYRRSWGAPLLAGFARSGILDRARSSAAAPHRACPERSRRAVFVGWDFLQDGTIIRAGVPHFSPALREVGTTSNWEGHEFTRADEPLEGYVGALAPEVCFLLCVRTFPQPSRATADPAGAYTLPRSAAERFSRAPSPPPRARKTPQTA